MATKSLTTKKPKLRVFTADGRGADRNGCKTCAAAQTVAGGRVLCRHNPPGTSTTGKAIWPTVDPEIDWCDHWHAT